MGTHLQQEAGFQAQIKSLKAAGCENVFAEQVSSLAEREQLAARALEGVLLWVWFEWPAHAAKGGRS